MKRQRWWKGMTPNGAANVPYCLIAALLFLLFSSWLLLPSHLDPLKSHPSANKAIPLDSSMNVPLTLFPCTTSLDRVSLVSTVVFTYTSPIQACPRMHAQEQRATGLLERPTLLEQVLQKAPQTTIICSSSEVTVILHSVPKLNLETIPKL